jgi:hypothetical protein
MQRALRRGGAEIGTEKRGKQEAATCAAGWLESQRYISEGGDRKRPTL